MQIGDMKLLPYNNPSDELQMQFQDDPPSLSLPFMWADETTLSDGRVSKASDGWNGPPVDDPLTLDLRFPLATEDDDYIVFRCSLEEVIDDMIDALKSPNSGKVVAAGEQAICHRAAARLRELADKLEQSCAVN